MAIEKKKKLSDVIIQEISQMVINGELSEGDKLPNQTEFAAQLGVSRLSLREALRTLELLGLVKQAPKRGTIICNANPAAWSSSTFPLQFDDFSTIKDIAVARGMIETETAKLSYGKDVSRYLPMLQALFDEMNEVLEIEDDETKFSKFTTLDTQFHMILVEIADNRFLTSFYSQLLVPMNKVIEFGFKINARFVSDAIEEHKRIIDALRENDIDGYVAHVNAHLAVFSEIIDKYEGVYS